MNNEKQLQSKRRTIAFRNLKHEGLTKDINSWIESSGANPISISVTHSKELLTYFHAFIIYELEAA